jgi:hypothetical protein
MRIAITSLALALMMSPAMAQQDDGPKDAKAQKTYKNAFEELHNRRPGIALDDFKKADKQDGGRCFACQKQMIKYGVELEEWKTAELAVEEMIAESKEEKEIALAHYQAGMVFMQEGLQRHKDEYFPRVHDEAGKALAAHSNFPDAVMLDGKALAQLKQDDAAKPLFSNSSKCGPPTIPSTSVPSATSIAPNWRAQKWLRPSA